MSKVYFCVSDIHSFYTELKQALKTAGFDKKNKEHILVVVGDLFDRGSEALKLYKFIKSIPKYRRVLIRGNHEQLYFSLFKKDYPANYDFSNGTVDTFCQITNYEFGDADYFRWGLMSREAGYPDTKIEQAWKNLRNVAARCEVTQFLQSPEWKYYFEIEKYIFTHSFIPVKLKQSAIDEFGLRAKKFTNLEYYEHNSDWRKASKDEWQAATWGCPFEYYKAGLFKPEEDAGKTLVCGHWHTADFFKHLKNLDWFDGQCAPIFFSKGLIGIDGGVKYSYQNGYEHPQNILVIKEDGCYNECGDKLEEIEAQPVIETVSIK